MDPEELFEVDSDVPDLSGSVLLQHFSGFVDAGSAGSTLVDHLLENNEHRVVARFDVDDLIDYRARRPAMTFATDQWESFDAPALVVHLLHDAIGTPFLLLTGPEPDRRWEAVTAAVRSLVARWGVRLTVRFHGIPMGVPGNLSALLELRLGQAGHDAVGFAAFVPHYLAQSTYPTATVGLVDAITKSTGLSIEASALHAAAQRTDAEITRQVAESEEVTEVVEALERQYDTFTSTSQNLLIQEGDPVPTADELAAEFERYLSEQ